MGKFRKAIAVSIAFLMMVPSIGVQASGKTEEPQEESVDSKTVEYSDTQEEVESYGYDSIVEEAEKEQEYRDSVDYVDNTIVFSVLDYRKAGEKAKYLKESDAICKDNNLKKVEYILDTKKEDVEQKDGYTAYQVFYMATVKTNDIWQVVDTLSADENILTAEPDYIWEKSDENDMTEVSGEVLSAEVECAGWSYDDLSITGIWNSLTQHTAPGEGVVVAVIDTGVDYNHVDLKKNIWVNSGEIAGNGIDDDGNGYIDDIHGINLIDSAKQGDPMDDHGHGTHVAGIIGMTAGNGGGVGIAYGSKIMAIKAGQASGVFASTDIAKAVQYAAANGADVINMSFGGTGKSSLVEAALADAFGSCVLVAAAGNDGLPTKDAPSQFLFKEDFYPAGYSYVLGVMACDSNGCLASFSNWDYYQYANCEYEMIAPGVQIYSTIPGNRYARWSGTSMAAPMVSATAAILRREFSDINKYSSRYIMGQLSSATRDSVTFEDKYGGVHIFKKLNISDSLNMMPKPSIGLSDILFFDGTDISEANNNDGVVQAGETIDLGFLISNHWGIAKDVSISVDAKSVAGIDNPYVQFENNSIVLDDEIGTFGTINNGYKYDNDELIGVDNPIRLKISDDAPNDLIVSINYSVSAKNGMDNRDSTFYKVEGSYSFGVQRGTYLRGVISEDMTLTSDKLWIVDRSLTVAEGVTVNVDPGTKIQFYSDEVGPYAELHITNITVKGTMLFNGTFEEPISIFPSKTMGDCVCEITTMSQGKVNMDYVDIINPYLDINKGNHLKLVQDTQPYTSRIMNISGVIRKDVVNGYRLLSFEKISNSIFKDFSSYSDNLEWVTPQLCGEINRVLVNDSFLNIHNGLWGGGSISEVVSCNNSVFLNAHRMTGYEVVGSTQLYIGTEDDISFSYNAILNDNCFEYRTKVCSSHYHFSVSDYCNLSKNYWGTTNENLIEKMVLDQMDDSELIRSDYSNYLTLEDDMSSIYPFVTEAYITDSTGEHRISEVVNSQTVQVHVKFNRDMAQGATYEPMVSFGPAEPYTDFVVNGDWASSREWVGTIKIDPFINQGTEYLRIKDATAADDLWLTTGTDSARFSFDITKSSAEALTLQGSGGSNENNLNWVQDDYDTLAGYNLYRATEYDSSKSIEEQSFTKINTSIIANDTKEYTDKAVEQGQDYYYYFTVVDTQFAESPASNIVKCTPFDEEKPVISTKAIETKTVGTAVNISADITDNVEVKEATLYYKSSGDESWKNIKMRNTSGDSYQAVIPAYDVKEGTMQYYISATDGTNTTTAGSEEVPNVFAVIGVIEVESITLNDTSKDITIGDFYQLEATVLPENATDKSVTWSSTDDSIATVDEEGNVSTVALGEATITATSKDGKKSAACNITVKPILVTSISIEPEEKTVLVEDTFTITPTVLPENATNKAINYESGNTKVATVDAEGKVTAVGVGEADITVSTDDDSDLSKICKVTVNPILVKSVSLSESSKTLDIGEDFTLTANIYPENATNKKVTWTSSNENVATVDEGKVTAVGGGKSTITVETEDGSFKAICNVTIASILTTDITLSKEELTLDVGKSETLTVNIDPVNATSTTYTWKSDDKDIATVKNGTVTAVTPGKTFIKCTTTDGTDITKICSVEVFGKYDKPAKPIVLSKSLTSVTLKSVKGALYSTDGTTWVESNEFTGLTENTEYSFYVKLKADGYYHESDMSDATVVKTDESTISVTGIELDKNELNLMVNDTAKLTATIEPDNSSIQDLNWISTNTSVATVDNNGNITAKAIGLTYVICKSVDGSDKTAISTVKVYDQFDAPEKIEADAVTEDSIKIKVIEGCEYKIGTGGWSDTIEFTGLKSNTEYEISARKAADGYHKASEAIIIKIKTEDHTHVYGELVAEVPASCTKDGIKAHYKCSVCSKLYVKDGDSYKETSNDDLVIKATGHTEETTPAVPASCTKAGNTAGKKCSVCGEIIEPSKEIPATGHKWDEGVVTKEPTETDKGIKTYTCTVCKETKTEEIPAKGKKDDSSNPNTTPTDKQDDQKPSNPAKPDEGKETSAGEGVGTISSDGTILTDTNGVRYYVSAKVKAGDLKNNLKVADKKSGGKYKITKVTKKKGKVTGGTVTYMAPYNKNCTKATAANYIKIGGVKFNITAVNANAFKGCTKLKSFTVGENITTIGKNAFKDCKNLKTFTIKSLSLKSIGANSFKGVNAKIKFKVPKKKLDRYERMIRKAGAPKSSKITK